MTQIVRGMSITDYHNHPSISRSALSMIWDAKTPAHYIVDCLRDKKTEALRFGHAFHTFILEPDLYAKYAQPYSETKTTSAQKFIEAETQLTGTPFFLVLPDWEEKIKRMAHSVLANQNARALLDKKGDIEPSFFWHDDEYDVDVKCRPDYLVPGIPIDFKKTENKRGSAHEDDFWRSIVDYNYDVQVYMNMCGIKAVTGEEQSAFLFIVVEDDEPFGCNLIAASDDVILSGKIKYERMMKKYLEFKGRQDCYSHEIKTAKLPDWYMTKLIGGQNV